LSRAGLAPGQRLFSEDARELIFRASSGVPRRIKTRAHASMVEAAERGSGGIYEDHVRSAALNRGLKLPPQASAEEPAAANGRARGSWFQNLFSRRRA